MSKAKLKNANHPIDGEKPPIRKWTRSHAELMDSSKPPLGRTALALPGADESVDSSHAPGRWHSRGYLPHFESRELIQHVTFHLADSLPIGVLDKLSQEIKRLPAERQDAEKRKRVEEWMDAGHGDCILSDASIAEAVQNALLFSDGRRYRLLAWVVMPNHVHALFQPLNGWTVAKIVASWKKFTARKIFDQQRNRSADPGNANLLIGVENSPIRRSALPGTVHVALPASTAGAAGVWHREYWDRYIRDENHYQQTVMYIQLNPVKAGLIARAEDWRWSSAASINTINGKAFTSATRGV